MKGTSCIGSLTHHQQKRTQHRQLETRRFSFHTIAGRWPAVVRLRHITRERPRESIHDIYMSTNALPPITRVRRESPWTEAKREPFRDCERERCTCHDLACARRTRATQDLVSSPPRPRPLCGHICWLGEHNLWATPPQPSPRHHHVTHVWRSDRFLCVQVQSVCHLATPNPAGARPDDDAFHIPCQKARDSQTD